MPPGNNNRYDCDHKLDNDDDRGQTPLHHAAFCGSEGVASLLLRHGADGAIVRNSTKCHAFEPRVLVNPRVACITSGPPFLVTAPPQWDTGALVGLDRIAQRRTIAC